MSRPKIICHMHTLLNGKVDGVANITDVGWQAQREYFDLMLGPERFYSAHRGWLSGRGTSEAIMGGPKELSLPPVTEPVPEGDYLAQPDADMFYFAVDSQGKLAWDRSSFDYFGVQAHIVSIIGGSVGQDYKAFLRNQGISYIIAGEKSLDMAEAVRKIGDLFQMEELMLAGGPTLNWGMIREGLVDELSIVLMPTADAQNHTSSLFESHEKYATPMPYKFDFKAFEPLKDGSVWLRYDVAGPIQEK